jgi:hypothetical protein
MFITVTAANGAMNGKKIDLVVDKVFGVCYSETLNMTVVLSDNGANIPVQESAEVVKNLIKQQKLSTIKSE